MYRGRVVERGPADDVILNPQHAYTQLLALAAHDPERPGKLIGTSAGDRTTLDNQVTYDHHTRPWTSADGTARQSDTVH